MREEFIIATYVKEHPLSLIEQGREDFFVSKLAEGIEKVVRAFNPRPVILRFSDFKTNEYRDLKGGAKYEPHEENPMIGWRGCSRYISPAYEPAFRLELKAVKKVRKRYKNLWVMLPFVRNVEEVKKINQMMKEEGLERSKDLKLLLMAEVPCNVFLADQFSQYCDGFSIGSNDLTQLILGVDRDSVILAKMGEFDERNLAVKRAISHLITVAHRYGKTVGICGQAPSEYSEFAHFLVDQGIDSISVNPDVVEKTKFLVAAAERHKR
jgi:pyruvate,water dikinase